MRKNIRKDVDYLLQNRITVPKNQESAKSHGFCLALPPQPPRIIWHEWACACMHIALQARSAYHTILWMLGDVSFDMLHSGW
jgi:hypothetical protein